MKYPIKILFKFPEAFDSESLLIEPGLPANN
ncbi:hypothetical protein AREALGSMS7_02777 [Arenibacter algicola]|uniref:Uncharacterized protein n=1 Tax=Arenibacter algicola TaxID=616991 RepID=A0A221UY02_9FLAO|nr:hypothetical protein AREALGSMS7_02777 [Arenibacter algicola]